MRLAVSTLALAVSLAITAPAFAQTADPAAEARIRADVTFLADDMLEGRNTGERGYDLAALYVQTRMAGLGIQPGGVDGTWRQPITFARAHVEAASLTISSPNGEPVVFQSGRDGAFSIGDTGGLASAEGSLVFVGYGLDAPEHGFDDYADADVSGKIVVMLRGAPAGTDPAVAGQLSQGKAAAAKARGAVGMITVNTAETAGFYSDARLSRIAANTSVRWAGPDGVLERATLLPSASLNDAAATRLFEGAGRSYAELKTEASQAGARPASFDLTGSGELAITTAREDMRSDNVIGLIPGSDPVLKNEYVVLTAHLDHIGMEEEGEDRINNGALDNAGGIATQLEAARALAASPPKRSILVVALTAEELGLLGSDYLAQYPVVSADKVIANVNLDMPILTYDFTDVVAFGAEHSTMGPLVATAAQTEGLVLSPDPMPEQGVFTRSDHFSFVQQGVPSVMLATGYANGGEQAWGDFFAHGYHQPSDEIGEFNWSAAAKFARVNAAIARIVADTEARPLWYEGNPFGDQFAPDAPKAPAPTN